MKRLIPSLILSIVSCGPQQKQESTAEQKFNGEATVRQKISPTLVPDSTGITLLFDELIHKLSDSGAYKREYILEIGMTEGNSDSLTLGSQWRYFIAKDTGSTLTVTIQHGNYKNQFAFDRDTKMNADSLFAFTEHGPFPKGRQRYDVVVTMRNFRPKGELNFTLDSWDMVKKRK